MKKNVLLPLFLFLFLTQAMAQLTADAGSDLNMCLGSSTTIGGPQPGSGGTPPYTYEWTENGNVFDVVANPTINTTLWGIGNYVFTLTVTDALGDTASSSINFEVSQQLSLNATASDTIGCGSLQVSFSASVSGTMPPYSYLWDFAGLGNSNSDNPTYTFADTGTYAVVVSAFDASACFVQNLINITVFPSVSVVGNVAPVSCSGAGDGSIDITPFGAAPFTYFWNIINTPFDEDQLGLPAGTYEVTVTDANGCSAGNSFNVTETNPLTIIPDINNVLCFGGNNGGIVAYVSGGTAPYAYIWNNGQQTLYAYPLAPGTYSLTVIDANNCTLSGNFTVNEPAPIIVSMNAFGESLTGACDGSIVIAVGNGTPPYTYAWSNNSTLGDQYNLCAGTYSVTITDANGCSAVNSTTVVSNCLGSTLSATINSQDLSCLHPIDTLTAVVTGGNPPYSINWGNGDIATQPGIYTIYVTDNTGCGVAVADTVYSTNLTVAVSSFTNTACNSNNSGSIDITVVGGTPPFSYQWSNGANTQNITNLAPGIYTLTVTDATQCTAALSQTISSGGNVWSYYVYTSTTPVNCGIQGTASVYVGGGTPPFTYAWNTTPAQNTQTATGLPSGSYMVTVTGADGCTREATVYVGVACYTVIEGYLYNDTNGNCVKDSGETAVPNAILTATNGSNTYYGYGNSTGHYTIQVGDTGNYSVTVSISGWGSCTNANVCGAQNVNVSPLGSTISNINFGFGAVNGYNLALHPGWTSANPGFTKEYWILWYQQSLPAYTGTATVVFKYDSILQYQSHTQGGVHNAANRTITWSVNNVPYPSWNWGTKPHCYFTVPANTPIGYQLKQEFWISPTANDCDSSNNHLVSIQPVSGSMDPNEKQVQPEGDIQEEDSVLTYTIHFQNTGNDTTFFIILKDTLSPHLNPASVVNIASSHEYESFTISDNGILTWFFNPIFLVDSATNEPASKGFVMFRIKKKAGLPLNTEIKNKASIYFDYNEPIVTNTVSSKLTDPNSIYNLNNDNSISVTAAPNPFTNATLVSVEGITTAYHFQLFDVSGKLLKNIPQLNESSFVLQRDNMSPGVYFYSITTASKQKVFGRLVVQ